MKRFAVLFLLSIAISSWGQDIDLKVGVPFPVIDLPRSDSGKLESIQSYRGKKTMVHVFAGW